MKVLVLGGTLFLGRHIVAAALEMGHELTLFNRGRTNPGLFPQIETVIGDRATDIERLEGTWDLVIDCCGYVPRIVELAVTFLADRAAHYTFVSSASVYKEPVRSGTKEDAELAVLEGFTEDVNGETFGPLKALCEDVVREAFPKSHTVVRPGLIVGPWDPTDRFTYWPARLARPGPAIAPGDPNRLVQWIDARDLAVWLCSKSCGTFNAASKPVKFAKFLGDVSEALGETSLEWIPSDFLLEQGVSPWVDFPLWLTESENGMLEIDVESAHDNGLETRSLGDTARDTWSFIQGLDRDIKAGLTADREAAILKAWCDSKNC